MWLQTLLIAFLTGVLVKIVDDIEDYGKDKYQYLGILLGMFYGFLIYYMFAVNTEVIPLWLGIVIGMLFAGKIDAFSHYFGFGTFITLILIFGIPAFSITLFLLFLVVAVLDELSHAYVTKHHRAMVGRPLARMVEIRPFVEIVALIVSLFTKNWYFFFAILAFDAGYLIVRAFENQYIKH